MSEPFEVWGQPEGMADVIASVVGRLGLGGAPVAMTTTAELVDVSASNREGVLYVLEAARNALPGRRLRVLTIAGEQGSDEAREEGSGEDNDEGAEEPEPPEEAPRVAGLDINRDSETAGDKQREQAARRAASRSSTRICVPALSGTTCQSIAAATVSALRLKAYPAARRLLSEL